MQIEHIDENTIRVRIDKQELASRGLKMLDLLGDKDKIQDFFYTILEEVDKKHEFPPNMPVTFQVMPNKGGLDLLISKAGGLTDPQKVQKMHADMAKNDHPGAGLANLFDRTTIFSEIIRSAQVGEPNEDHVNQREVYRINSLSAVAELAHSLVASDLAASLYEYRGVYYLDLAFLDSNYSELKPMDAWTIANEFGTAVSRADFNVVKRLGKVLIQRDALSQLRSYFK
ncbi:MAG: adaptor protein MecA [Lactobacillus sp.]